MTTFECTDKIRLVDDDGEACITIDASTGEVDLIGGLDPSTAARMFWGAIHDERGDIESDAVDQLARLSDAFNLGEDATVDEAIAELERLREAVTVRNFNKQQLAGLRQTDGVPRNELVARIGDLCDSLERAIPFKQDEKLQADHDTMLANLTQTQKRSTELLHAARAAALPRDGRQERVVEWARSTFGDVAMSRQERALRFIEEAIELAQAEKLPEESVASVLRHVYGKPSGTTEQEAGGVAVTLLALCGVAGISADLAETLEIGRVMGFDPGQFRDRQNAKADAGIAVRTATLSEQKVAELNADPSFRGTAHAVDATTISVHPLKTGVHPIEMTDIPLEVRAQSFPYENGAPSPRGEK